MTRQVSRGEDTAELDVTHPAPLKTFCFPSGRSYATTTTTAAAVGGLSGGQRSKVEHVLILPLSLETSA